jgi:hypothetical protein
MLDTAASYVARIQNDFDIDSGVGKILIEAPPNAHLIITSVAGWGQTADKAYFLGIAPPGYGRLDGGKVDYTLSTGGPYPLAFGIATLNGATTAIPYSLMNNDRVATGLMVIPAGWSLYIGLQQSGNSGTLSASASGILHYTSQTSNFGG